MIYFLHINYMFGKNNFSGFLGKGIGDKLIGAGKGLARLVDEPIVHAGISALSPELGGAIAVAKRVGLLEKLKH
jgi:hypothetical protein